MSKEKVDFVNMPLNELLAYYTATITVLGLLKTSVKAMAMAIFDDDNDLPNGYWLNQIERAKELKMYKKSIESELKKHCGEDTYENKPIFEQWLIEEYKQCKKSPEWVKRVKHIIRRI